MQWFFSFSKAKKKIVEILRPRKESESEGSSSPGPSDEPDLGVVFQYNGHSFEAYESLGITRDATRQEIEEAYLLSPKTESGEVEELFRLAYYAIVNKN